jgi:hypothetical protein
MPSASECTWKPTILAAISSSRELTGSYRFLWALTKPQGRVHAPGIYPSGERERVANLETLTRAFVDKTAAYHFGIVLLARDSVVETGREQQVNVWVTPQGPEREHAMRRSIWTWRRCWPTGWYAIGTAR